MKVPLVAMKGGIDLQKYVDILLPAAPATIKIVQVVCFEALPVSADLCNGNHAVNLSHWTDVQYQGNGPVHLVGSHCVERMMEDREEGEEEEAEDDDDTSDDKTANK